MKFPFSKILIANRGEIAVRVIRAAKELGLQTVAIYSEVDVGSAHVLLADQAVCIGPAEAKQSYLSEQKIFAAAKATGADAIHPGFGFLSENAAFAKACAREKIIFIGPKPETITLMGDKLAARGAMKSAGVPIVPGSDGALSSLAEINAVADRIGFPIILKAAAGGGGKGMRVVTEAKDLAQAFETTSREALNYFGNGAVFMERYVDSPHHIEVQLIGDHHGNVVHLFERECSMQRRHQKVIEEAPSPFLVGHDDVRERLFKVAVEGAKRVGYTNAGTMEFVMDGERNFYFLEMNTRIQVEHPVSEMITGIDLVKEQILVAAGAPLSFTQESLQLNGAAIECRLYAENPYTFLPSPGRITELWLPGGPFVRIDSAMLPGKEIPIEYDPMVAKISTWGRNRAEAIARMSRALGETLVAGTLTNLEFLRKALVHKVFCDGNYTTKFIADNAEALSTPEKIPSAIANQIEQIMQATLATEQKVFSPTETSDWWRSGHV
jgi:acetyl-CoA carboxylase, biotin carboxylase subunit